MSLTDSQSQLCRTPDHEDEYERRQRKVKQRQFAKSSAKFICTQVALVVAVCLYAVVGGFIFQHLESTNEMEECKQGEAKYLPMENDTIYKMWSISSSFRAADDKPFAVAEFHKQLVKFRDNLLSLGFDGTNCTAKDYAGGPGYQWSFTGSLLFSTTVFTTVGYGNIAPKTFWGRLVCIAYAVLGIPLMLLCLANIGEIMANVFRYAYVHVCCCACGCCRRRVVRPRPSRPPSSVDNEAEAWKNRYNREKAAGDGSTDDVNFVDDLDDEEEEDEEKISVPLTVTIGMLGGFIFMGALLFGVLEGWDWLTSAYCCFVTISTIGFGDVVPGSDNFDSVVGQLKMLVAAVYMVFGMALLSMAFNLLQEEMVGKFKWLGTKLGIVKKDDDEDDDEGGPPHVNTPVAPATAVRQPQVAPQTAPMPPYFGKAHDKTK